MCLLKAPRISLGFGIKRELLLKMDEGVRVRVDEGTALSSHEPVENPYRLHLDKGTLGTDVTEVYKAVSREKGVLPRLITWSTDQAGDGHVNEK